MFISAEKFNDVFLEILWSHYDIQLIYFTCSAAKSGSHWCAISRKYLRLNSSLRDKGEGGGEGRSIDSKQSKLFSHNIKNFSNTRVFLKRKKFDIFRVTYSK